MIPLDYIKSVYTKDGKIKKVDEQWVTFYLNKCLIQDKDNAERMSMAMQYCLYLSPTHYFYLLYMLIPKKFNYTVKSTKKAQEPEEDKLVDKLKYIMGWSTKEYESNKKQITATILNNREYWEKELGVQNERPRKRKTV
jgi:hypothetical protein